MSNNPNKKPDKHVGEDVKVRLREDGKTDNFFGGKGKPDGPGHGHIVVTDKGEVVHIRESAKHGGEVLLDKKDK